MVYHLLNDYSGSPKVLAMYLNSLVERGYKVDVFSSFNNAGVLDDLKGVKKFNIYYKFYENKFLRLLAFAFAQIMFFINSFRYLFDKNTVFYINTILPLGGALGGALMKKKIIYHVHEVPINKNTLNKLAVRLMLTVSSRIVFVSNYVSKSYLLKDNLKSAVIYNFLDNAYLTYSSRYNDRPKKGSKILMVSSLKVYKGVDIFVELAKQIYQQEFVLVVNANDKEIKQYFRHTKLPSNLLIHSAQADLHRFYRDALIVLNLSIPSMVVETFGMTILEAMAYGKPVIVPSAGGPLELVAHGKEGFTLDSRDMKSLIHAIESLINDEELYEFMANNARSKSGKFELKKSIEQFEALIR